MMHLRNMNTYVASALGDWSKSHHLQPSIPLQAVPHPSATPQLKAAGAHPSHHLRLNGRTLHKQHGQSSHRKHSP